MRASTCKYKKPVYLFDYQLPTCYKIPPFFTTDTLVTRWFGQLTFLIGRDVMAVCQLIFEPLTFIRNIPCILLATFRISKCVAQSPS